MHDEKLGQYKKQLEKTEVPKELKEKTIAKMKEQAPENEKVSSSRRWIQTPYVAAAIALLLIGGGAYAQLGNHDSEPIAIAQELEKDGMAEQVALTDGNLTFSKISTEFQSFGMQMGVLEEANAEDENVGEAGVHYEYVEEETCEGAGYEIFSMEGAIPDEEESRKLAESHIGETAIRIGYYGEKDKTVYVAYFQTGGTGYKVKGIGVTQENFVQKLISMSQW